MVIGYQFMIDCLVFRREQVEPIPESDQGKYEEAGEIRVSGSSDFLA